MGSGAIFRPGLLPKSSLSPLVHLFPNLSALWDSPFFVQLLLVIAILAAVLFAIGLWDRVAAIILWYLGACLLGRNPLIANPALPYVGWLLLAHSFLPDAPLGSVAARIRREPNENWHMPPDRPIWWHGYLCPWATPGVMKLASPSWLDGSALARILSNPLARPGMLRHWLLALPIPFLKVV